MGTDNPPGVEEKGDLLLIQFAKSPVPGQVKTRMMPQLNAQAACDLHEALVRWTCRRLCQSGLGPVELWVSGDPGHAAFAQCIGYGAAGIRAQEGSDLGQRMSHAVADALARHAQVILVGSDCPSIDSGYLSCAQRALSENSVVLGPANDGGYVLLAAKKHVPAMFAGISWGQSSVFTQTVAILSQEKRSWAALSSLPDIDRPEDLPTWLALSESAVSASN